MHHRRARPTLRVLKEDLTSGWGSPLPRRALASGDHVALHPLSELDHPIVRKCAEVIGADEAEDNGVGRVESSRSLVLVEVKTSQWRGGVWRDPESGVHWLVVAGLAKGDHEDHDDFYLKVDRRQKAGSISALLPTDDDVRLLKQETSFRLLTEWELMIQASVRNALEAVSAGGSVSFDVPHVVPSQGRFTSVRLEVSQVREDGYAADELELAVGTEPRFRGSDLEWRLIVRLLISIHPPEQSWDRVDTTFLNIAEPGEWRARARVLSRHVEAGELALSAPGTHAHFSHRRHLAGATIAGTGVRALCGSFFVPAQDHERLPVCPTCEERLAVVRGV